MSANLPSFPSTVAPTINDNERTMPALVSTPVDSAERILSIDVMRGFALLGILVMNIQSFSMPDSAYFIPTTYGDLTGVNYWVWYFCDLFADQKFMSIFSMLFGAGVVLMTSRMESRGRSAMGVHYRRMLILLLFGLMHAYLLWTGDILYTYAMCGLVLYLFRRVRPSRLILLAVIVLAIGWFTYFLTGWGIISQGLDSPMAQDMASDFAPPPEVIQAQLEAFRSGWIEQFMERYMDVIMFQTFVFIFYVGWRVGGMMLLGMALFKWGIFSAKRSVGFYIGMTIVGFAIGIPCVSHEISLNEQVDWEPIQVFFIHSQWNYLGSIMIALGYVGVVMLICKLGVFRWLQRALAAVGQMALTNYLMHTIACTFVFYGGWGLGYYGTFERWQQAVLVACVWIAQLVISPIWMRYFRFGPFEWLWRTMTYGRLQPMRRVPVNTVS